VFYYVGLVGSLAVLVRLYPGVLTYLPMFGLSELKQGGISGGDADFVTLITQVRVPMDLWTDGIKLAVAMIGALIVMIPLRWVYLGVGDLEVAEHTPPERKVSASLLLLPLVVTAIIVIVKFSLALAFALTGIFAGVRYRTSLKNLTDALFVFACMAVGLAAGTEALGVALALSIFFAFTSLCLEPLIKDDPEQAQEEPIDPPR
jgi:hypothetical protein